MARGQRLVLSALTCSRTPHPCQTDEEEDEDEDEDLEELMED